MVITSAEPRHDTKAWKGSSPLALRNYYICVSASIDSETVPLCVLECALLDIPLCAIGVHGLVYISS